MNTIGGWEEDFGAAYGNAWATIYGEVGEWYESQYFNNDPDFENTLPDVVVESSGKPKETGSNTLLYCAAGAFLLAVVYRLK